MAGAIFVSKDLRLPVSTREFDYLAQRIRLAFDAEGQTFLREIYSPSDDAGMNIISAEYGGGAGLHAFFRAVVRARQKDSGEPGYEVYARFWNDLLALIRLDPRFLSEWEKSDVAS